MRLLYVPQVLATRRSRSLQCFLRGSSRPPLPALPASAAPGVASSTRPRAAVWTFVFLPTFLKSAKEFSIFFSQAYAGFLNLKFCFFQLGSPIFSADPSVFSARPSGSSRPVPRGFLSLSLGFSRPTLGFSRPDPRVFPRRTLGVFLGLTLGFSRLGPPVFLSLPRGFLSPTLGISSALLSVFLEFGRRCPPLRFSSSHAGLCGHTCPRFVVHTVPTSPGPCFPYLLFPGFLWILSPPPSRAFPLTGFYDLLSLFSLGFGRHFVGVPPYTGLGPSQRCFLLPGYFRLFERRLLRLPRGSGSLNRYILIVA